jgi:hypothetical protein
LSDGDPPAKDGLGRPAQRLGIIELLLLMNPFRIRPGPVLACVGLLVCSAFADEAVLPPPKPPAHVTAVRQDFQAVRVQWEQTQPGEQYYLYAAVDGKHPAFHKENEGHPLSGRFVIWDAPRDQGRKFAFYITTVDIQGRESKPSKIAHINLGPPPHVPN